MLLKAKRELFGAPPQQKYKKSQTREIWDCWKTHFEAQEQFFYREHNVACMHDVFV